MIDPKFNELPDTARPGSETDTLSQTKPRSGLSINDTIAADANLSVGSRGTDVSGVRAGAGAGAGSTYVTPASRGESPAPNVVPDARGSGMTPLSDTAPGQTPTRHLSPEETRSLTHEEIASHAYRCWHQRGCPEGSPEEDWHRAERELRERHATPKTSSATA
ncbi:MAG: DUF2934 domain-containing protein [Acidobacteriaceae bacterium]|nr:DUF2934 domain-containing protein [Acidobacteriaceae bacterium]